MLMNTKCVLPTKTCTANATHINHALLLHTVLPVRLSVSPSRVGQSDVDTAPVTNDSIVLTSGAGALADDSLTVAVVESVRAIHITGQGGIPHCGNGLAGAAQSAVVSEVALTVGREHTEKQISDRHSDTHTTAYTIRVYLRFEMQ